MDADDVKLPEMRPPSWSKDQSIEARLDYDRVSDRLFVWFADPRPTFAHPAGDYMLATFDLETGEFVGLEIERFAGQAIQHRTELLPLWDAVKPSSGPIERLRTRVRQPSGATNDEVQRIARGLVPSLA